MTNRKITVPATILGAILMANVSPHLAYGSSLADTGPTTPPPMDDRDALTKIVPSEHVVDEGDTAVVDGELRVSPEIEKLLAREVLTPEEMLISRARMEGTASVVGSRAMGDKYSKMTASTRYRWGVADEGMQGISFVNHKYLGTWNGNRPSFFAEKMCPQMKYEWRTWGAELSIPWGLSFTQRDHVAEWKPGCSSNVWWVARNAAGSEVRFWTDNVLPQPSKPSFTASLSVKLGGVWQDVVEARYSV